MLKSIALVCSIMLISALCYAQKTKRKEQVVDDGKSLLWKITGNGLTKPSFMFGTIHIICPDDYVWTPTMQNALKQSEQVVFEMDMDDPSLQAQMTKGMMTKDGKKLKDYYTEEEYTRLNEVAVKNGIPLAMLQNIEPFGLISFLYMKASSCQVPDSYEGNIMKLAQKDDKEILGLESLDEQLKVIDGMDNDSIAKQVLKIVDDLDSFKITFQSMLSLYKKQDLPALHNLFLESPDYKDDLDALLYSRNKKWVPIMSSLAEAKPTFFAVGAGHLYGQDGVIELLQKTGYTVTAIK